MSSTLTPTCPLCGLGYSNQALLELHIREDHARHRPASEEPQRDAWSRPPNEVTTTTAAPQPRRPRSPSALKAARPGIHTLGKLSRQLAGRMAARFSPPHPRRPLAAGKPPADHDPHAPSPERSDRATTR
jgi:hypothetical protein